MNKTPRLTKGMASVAGNGRRVLSCPPDSSVISAGGKKKHLAGRFKSG